MSDISIRSLYPEDLDQVSGIESSLAGKQRREFMEKRLAVASVVPDSFITCAALHGERLTGYGFARILEGEFGEKSVMAVLDTIGVDPDYQGKGIGMMILSGIERRMMNKNISTIQTEVSWPNNSLVKFFASNGFVLASGQIIERDTSLLNLTTGEAAKMDDKPSRNQVVVRPLKGEDIAAIDRIDMKLTGLDRSAYFATKFREMLDESGIRVSMVSEVDGIVTGFVMARVDYGEFGEIAKSAVIDTIGVHPVHAGSGVGQALLSQLLIDLSGLQVESVRTKVDYENYHLRNFLSRRGFRPSQRLLLAKKIY